MAAKGFPRYGFCGGFDGCRDVTEVIPNQLLEKLMMLLDPLSILRCASVNKRWRSVAVTPRVWHNLCKLRWRMRTSISRHRVYSCKSWVEVYRHLSKKLRMPKGIYTGNRTRVFATGRCNGLDMWVSLSHRPDCSLLRKPHEGGRMARVRITIQNTRNSKVWIPTKSTDLGLVALQKDGYIQAAIARQKPQRTLRNGRSIASMISEASKTDIGSLEPKVIAFNGSPVDCGMGDGVLLGPLDFTVIQAHMDASTLTFEPEFLERLVEIQISVELPYDIENFEEKIPLSGHECKLRKNWRRVEAKAKFKDDREIWKHYSMLPGGCMYLNDMDVLRDHERQQREYY